MGQAFEARLPDGGASWPVTLLAAAPLPVGTLPAGFRKPFALLFEFSGTGPEGLQTQALLFSHPQIGNEVWLATEVDNTQPGQPRRSALEVVFA